MVVSPAPDAYVARVKDVLYGTELGEAPPLRVCAADAVETISGSLVTFTVATGEGAEIKAGHTLAVADHNDVSKCYAVYVTSVTSNAITGYNGYMGAPAVVASGLDSKILEQNPLVTTYKIHKAIDTVFATSLWPEIFKYVTTTVTPNLATGQAALAAAAMDIHNAYQNIGGIKTRIPAGISRNVHSTVATNGVLGEFEFCDGSTAYLTYVAKLILGDEDEDTNGLIEIVATGAAALCLGAAVSETNLASSSKDSQGRQKEDVAARLWRDFLTLRGNLSEGLSRDRGNRFRVSRG